MTEFKHFRLPRILDKRGNLSVFENNQYFSFEIGSVSWVHAHQAISKTAALGVNKFGQTIIVLKGKISLYLSDGTQETQCIVDDSNNCIYIPAGLRLRLSYCADNTSAFIASNEEYETNNPILQFFKEQPVAAVLC